MDWTIAGTVVAVILTLMVYSYLLGDNVLFKLAEHILVGVSVGFAAVTITFSVFVPAVRNVRDELNAGNTSAAVLYLIPVLAGLVLLLRPLRAARPLTNIVVAFVIGTVAALSLAGTLAGTLIPQVGATMLPLTHNSNGDNADVIGIIGNVVLVLCAVLTLWYFQFTLRKNRSETSVGNSVPQTVRLLGRWTLMTALGAVFASVFLTYLAALIDRLSFFLKLGS